ncbi:hypothetical protein C0J52_24579 [Blattella germanica]|nr:hypothetical protein C0J52_24579 [Blattella germanica]
MYYTGVHSRGFSARGACYHTGNNSWRTLQGGLCSGAPIRARSLNSDIGNNYHKIQRVELDVKLEDCKAELFLSTQLKAKPVDHLKSTVFFKYFE